MFATGHSKGQVTLNYSLHMDFNLFSLFDIFCRLYLSEIPAVNFQQEGIFLIE